MRGDQEKILKEIDQENSRFNKLAADMWLDNVILKAAWFFKFSTSVTGGNNPHQYANA